MFNLHKTTLCIAVLIILAELGGLLLHWETAFTGFQQYWWLVILPFGKTLLKRLLAMKLWVLFKGVLILCWHVGKLLLLKLLKSLGLRYGMFFSQRRWYAMRKVKVLFLRRGKQLSQRIKKFWQHYQAWQKTLIVIAFFPIFIVLFILGLSFQATRKTVVQKTQETALVKMAATASQKNQGLRGLRGVLARLDQRVLNKIKQLTDQLH